mmetsp:Transcript_24023/g.44169  ORF Transcript_24023/g.44169 Transcript_24023/m.44169 type:complete len:91 (+) Transcript_24023:1291-1563(+)
MAAPDPSRRQPAALDRAMFFQCFKGVGAACGLVTAVKPNPGRKDQAVRAHGQCNDKGERGHASHPNAVRNSFRSCANGREAVTSARPIST